MKGQTSAGNWTVASRGSLASFIDGDISDATVKGELAKLTLTADLEFVYLTLLAIYILEEAFADYEDEWQLIVSNAKAFLEGAGVPKPANLVKKFSLTISE